MTRVRAARAGMDTEQNAPPVTPAVDSLAGSAKPLNLRDSRAIVSPLGEPCPSVAWKP